MTELELYKIAAEATALAYAPYSGFAVGAALLTKSGKLYTGANIENSSYGATVCAERTALWKAVLDGEREFSALAVAARNANGQAVSAPPCGICRQTLSEFSDGSLTVLFGTENDLQKTTLAALLPHTFSL